MSTCLSSIEIVRCVKLYSKNRNIFYLKTGNLENYRLFISWYLEKNIYETHIPDNPNNKPWYIGNWELQVLANLLGIKVSHLLAIIKLLE